MQCTNKQSEWIHSVGYTMVSSPSSSLILPRGRTSSSSFFAGLSRREACMVLCSDRGWGRFKVVGNMTLCGLWRPYPIESIESIESGTRSDYECVNRRSIEKSFIFILFVWGRCQVTTRENLLLTLLLRENIQQSLRWQSVRSPKIIKSSLTNKQESLESVVDMRGYSRIGSPILYTVVAGS